MNYYIKGDAANADRIKAAFEKLGYDISWPEGCANPDAINIGVERNGAKYVVAETSEYIKDIIKTHPDYKELELPVEPKFKVGDWVVFNNSYNSIYQISEIRDSYYMITHTHGGSMSLSFSEVGLIRPWTIEDAQDGDVLVTTKIRSCPFIYRKTSYKNNLAYYYVGINGNGDLTDAYPKNTLFHFGLASDIVPATKEQRDLLFAKMKEAGYEWDSDKKELRRIKSHYDIANFKPFDKVLVRCGNDERWMIEFYCEYDTLVHTSHGYYPFMGIGDSYSQCIPFNNDTKHLLGTSDMPSEEYINW